MSRTHRSWLILAIVLATVILSATMPAFADQTASPPSKDSRVTLDLKDTDIKAALEALFRDTGKSFSLAANAECVIPALSFKDVSFDTALRSLTKSAGLVYRKESEVYLISKRAESSPEVLSPYRPMGEPAGDPEDHVRIEKVTLNYSSPSEILALMSSGGRQYAGRIVTGYPGFAGARGPGAMGGSPGYGYGSGYNGYNPGSGFLWPDGLVGSPVPFDLDNSIITRGIGSPYVRR